MNATGATVSVTGNRALLNAWLSHHARVCRSTLAELVSEPLASLMTWLVIGIALALPMILYVVLQNMANVSGDWGGTPRISVYLAAEVANDAGQTLNETIGGWQSVTDSRFISSQSALQEFQERSGFGDVLSTLDRNPLPHVIEVSPAESDPLRIAELVLRLEGEAGVDRVSVDLEWLERLYSLLGFGQRLVSALALVLGIGVILIMGNTIRLAIENRRQEIEIVKLVGGTDGFVRRPFLYLGFWYGVGGAICAALLVQFSLLFLSGPVESLAQSYRDDFVLQGPGATGYFLVFITGGLLGVAGALLAVMRHLSEIEPT